MEPPTRTPLSPIALFSATSFISSFCPCPKRKVPAYRASRLRHTSAGTWQQAAPVRLERDGAVAAALMDRVTVESKEAFAARWAAREAAGTAAFEARWAARKAALEAVFEARDCAAQAWRAVAWRKSADSPVVKAVAAATTEAAQRDFLRFQPPVSASCRWAWQAALLTREAAQAAPRKVVQAERAIRHSPLAEDVALSVDAEAVRWQVAEAGRGYAWTGDDIDWRGLYCVSRAQPTAAQGHLSAPAPKKRKRLTPMAERARRVGVTLKQESETVALEIKHGSPKTIFYATFDRQRLQIANHQLVARAEQKALRRRLNMG